MADDWLFDDVAQFLKSPMWTTPVQSFIDDACAVFDGTAENPHEFKKLHTEFSQLVDKLLGDHLGELGIAPEAFIAACEQNSNKDLNKLVSEYILALDDFPTFKRMMEKRNVELELEALKYVKVRGEDDELKRLQEEEDEQLRAAIAASIQDGDFKAQQLKMESAQLEHALAISLQLEAERVRKLHEEAEELAKQDAAKAAEQKKKIDEDHQKEVKRLEESFQKEKEELETAVRVAPAPTPTATPAAGAAAPSLPTPTSLPKATLGEVRLHRHTTFGGKAPLPDIKRTDKPAEAAAPAPAAPAAAASSNAPTPEEIAKRQAYLKAQRDRMVAQQKAQREKDLEDFMKKKQTEEKKGDAPKTEEPDEVQRMRAALGRRFKEDLIEETRQAALRAQQ